MSRLKTLCRVENNLSTSPIPPFKNAIKDKSIKHFLSILKLIPLQVPPEYRSFLKDQRRQDGEEKTLNPPSIQDNSTCRGVKRRRPEEKSFYPTFEAFSQLHTSYEVKK